MYKKEFIIRSMQQDDVDMVLQIQSVNYPKVLHESTEFVINHLALSATINLVAEFNKQLIGYPWDKSLSGPD